MLQPLPSKQHAMVEVLLEPCGQDVTVPENGCTLNESVTEYPPRDDRIEEAVNLTPIQKFYNGQSIFITGGTGFMGKLLIEKLLRGCSGISFIYLLVRPKKGKDVHQRIEELFDDPVSRCTCSRNGFPVFPVHPCVLFADFPTRGCRQSFIRVACNILLPRS